jgi:glycosyltransferase involved in cell wall biosynthesis
MSADEVAVVVPAHDEAARIAATVRALLSSGRMSEVVVVDDGSTDATADAAARAGARVVRLPRNGGKAGAVDAGVRATTAPVLLLCDADLEETAANLVRLLDPVLDGSADMAIAAPPRDGTASGFGLVESFARWGIERVARTRMERPLSGQRAVRRSALAHRRPSRGFGLEVGLTIDALRSGARVVEVPVAFRHARTGRDVAGFVHRMKQGLDVARALATRVASSRGPAA